MGVYIFSSIWEPIIKIGHYRGTNAWYRIAPRRGFYSASPPPILGTRVSAHDFELLFWFPTLVRKDEKWLQRRLSQYCVGGEWFSGEALKHVKFLVTIENLALTCSKKEAMERVMQKSPHYFTDDQNRMRRRPKPPAK